MPAVELDDIVPLVAGAAATEGADDGAQRAHRDLAIAVIGGTGELRHGIDRRGLGDDDALRQRCEHLREQGRAAARHVKNEAVRRA